jgi:tungstate transport system substrate-binding protein
MTDRRFALARKRVVGVAIAISLVVALGGCTQESAEAPAPEPTPEPTRLILASTTSTQDSGLFDVLIPAFEKANPGYDVEVIAVGTGEALTMGKNKDADVLFVHAKADEEAFVAEGFGTERRDVMYNDFVFLGAESDPAGFGSAAGISAALKSVASEQAIFVSRGDDSGTHKKEKKLWAAADIEPAGAWFLSTGQGMGESLKVASEKQGYILSDRATYLSMKDALDLTIVREGDSGLLNQYGVLLVSEAQNLEGAQAFADWITSDAGQQVIASFGVERFGQALFVPNAQ